MEDSFGWPNSIAVGYSQVPQSEPTDDLTNKTAAQRYEKIAVIGEGGMGQVWLGWDHVLKRNVAIKVPHGQKQVATTTRLQKEMLLVAKLDHPGIITIFDTYQEQETPCFVMALIHGDTLTTRLQHATSDDDYVLLRAIQKACETIAYAHQRGIIHRDLSPNNIILTAQNDIKIIDWGLALSVEEAQQANTPAGTPRFIAPEQQAGEPVTIASDVWSLGAILSHIIKATELSSPALKAIAEQATQADPNERYEDASALASELERWFKGQSIEAYDTTLWRQLKQLTRYYKRPLLIALTFIAAVFGTLLWGVWRTQQESIQTKKAEQIAQKHLATLHRKAATEALDKHQYLQANEESMKAHRASPHPKTLGLLSLLRVTPRPTHVRTFKLPPCEGTRYITSHPNIWVCRHGETVSVYQGDKKRWTKTYEALFRVRVHRDTLLILFRDMYLKVVNIHNGQLIRENQRHARFANLSDNTTYNNITRTFYDANGVSTTIALKEHVSSLFSLADGTLVHTANHNYMLKNGHLHKLNIKTNAQIEYAFQIGEVPWLLTRAGELLAMEREHITNARFSDYVKQAIRLPGTPYLVILGIQGTAQVFDTQTRRWILELPQHATQIRALSSDVVQMLWRNGEVQSWRIPKQRAIWQYKGMGHGFANVVWDNTSTTVAAVDGAGDLYVFEPRTGTIYPRQNLGDRVAKWVDVHPQSNHFYAVGMDSNGIKRFEVAPNAQLISHPLIPIGAGQRRIAVMHNQWMCLSNQGYRGYCISPDTKRHIHPRADDMTRQAKKPKSLIDLAPNPQRTQLILTFDSHLALWSPPKPPVRFQTNTKEWFASAINQAGQVATVNAKSLFLFNARGDLTRTWRLPSRPVDVAWRPGHPHIATAHLDGTIKLWHTDGALILTATPHNKRVGTFHISPNGQYLASAGWDGYVYVMDLSVIEAFAQP